MLKVIPHCHFDLSGIQPDFIVKVAGRQFPTYRFLLITQSDFFKKTLAGQFKEKDSKEYNFATGDPTTFDWIIKTIHGETFEIPTLEKALGYMSYISYFDIKQVDLDELHKQLTVTPEQFLAYIEALDKIYPEGFTQEVIDIIASKVRPTMSLAGLPPELVDAINKSPEYIFPGFDPIFTEKMLQLAERHKNDPVKYYYIGDSMTVFAARSLAEASLKLRKFRYLKLITETFIGTQQDSLDYVRMNIDYFGQLIDILEGGGYGEAIGKTAETISLDELGLFLRDNNDAIYENSPEDSFDIITLQ